MKRKTRTRIYQLAILIMFLILSGSCKKKGDNNPPSNTVTDIDGNVYHTVTIGTQVWTVENLKTTRYNNGISIPLVTDATAWYNLITPGYCWHNNDINYKDIYGALYDWYAVNTGKLAPVGWHVPSDAEWTILTDFLGGESVAGGKMKTIGTIEAGTGLWFAPNTGATNESGFTALPGGNRFYSGAFYDIGYTGYWWSSTETATNTAWYRYLNLNFSFFYSHDFAENVGFSVRCVRN